MTEEGNKTTSHLFVATATTQTNQLQSTGANTVTSSSSNGVAFYFQCAVVVTGVVGAVTNGLILYAMIVSKQHKKQLLIFNQNVYDLCSSLVLVTTYTLKLCNIRLSGMLGYLLCLLILSENLLWCSIIGSVINLLSITVERYLKVVYPALSKKVLRRWVLWSAMVFAWIASVVYNMVLTYFTTAVIDQVCYGYVIWNSRVAAVIHGVWNCMTFFVIVVCFFIFCYGCILFVFRRQASVMAHHSTHASSTAQAHSHQIQSNVVKTMILVSAVYVISSMPNSVYYLLVNINTDFTLLDSGYYIVMVLEFLYICANPFIYATKFEPVRRVLLDLIPCQKSQQAGDGEAVQMTGSRTAQRARN